MNIAHLTHAFNAAEQIRNFAPHAPVIGDMLRGKLTWAFRDSVGRDLATIKPILHRRLLGAVFNLKF